MKMQVLQPIPEILIQLAYGEAKVWHLMVPVQGVRSPGLDK